MTRAPSSPFPLTLTGVRNCCPRCIVIGAPANILHLAPYGDDVTDEPPHRYRNADVNADGHSATSEQDQPLGGRHVSRESRATLLTTPRQGTPTPITTPSELREVAHRFAKGHGPLAVDAERASGYRYTHRAYLIQIRRKGAGTALIDPVPFRDLRVLSDAMAEPEWILHAASQDLPCLTELGLVPSRLFDTELAARLTNFERVGLATLTESLLGYTLEKHHSAADWSTRPLPEPWLTYAALDVELLIELREVLSAELERQNKSEWARQEFEALIASIGQPSRPRPDPWRRTSGIHRIRGARALSRVRALWYARDQIAARRDTSPGRVLTDSAIIAAADADPLDDRELLALPGFSGRSVRRLTHIWLEALSQARLLPDSELPTTPTADGPPPPHRWAERDPVAATRLGRAREVITNLAIHHTVPPENLITPDFIRRLAWKPPEPITPESVAMVLTELGARGWQVKLIASQLTAALLLSPDNPDSSR